MAMSTKFCPPCGVEVPVDRFSRNKNNPDGLGNLCKFHASEASKKSQLKSRMAQQLPGLEPVELIGRPESGRKCATCPNILYHYENDKCLRCSRKSIITARNTVPAMAIGD